MPYTFIETGRNMKRLCVPIIAALAAISYEAHAGAIEDTKTALSQDDAAHAIAHLTAAAEQGDIAAQRALAVMYDQGQNVPKDKEQAFKWLLKAAGQGDAEAQYLVGTSYKSGDGVLKDEVEGLAWRRKAADNGYAKAQVALGYDYTYGFGVQRNSIEAVKFFHAAALQGDAAGQNFLGEAYAAGRGIDHDDRKAQEWFIKAASQGFTAAQFNLGNLYLHSGAQIKTDPVLGYMWLEVAAQQKDSAAAVARDAAVQRLTKAELEKAQALAKTCKNSQYKNCARSY